MKIRSRGIAWLVVVTMTLTMACKDEDANEASDDGTTVDSTQAENPAENPTDDESPGFDEPAEQPCPVLALKGPPKVTPNLDEPFSGGAGGYTRIIHDSDRGELKLVRYRQGEYPQHSVEIIWDFDDLPTRIAPPQKYIVVATGVCRVEPDHTWLPGEASTARLTGVGVSVIEQIGSPFVCYRSGNEKTTGELRTKVAWTLQAEIGTETAKISIGDGGRIGTIAEYEYVCK